MDKGEKKEKLKTQETKYNQYLNSKGSEEKYRGKEKKIQNAMYILKFNIVLKYLVLEI